MSLASLADNKVVAQRRTATGVSLLDAARTADGQPVGGVPANIVNQLMLFIPTETVTLWVGYIALVNIGAPAGLKICRADFANLWLAFWIFALATPALLLGLTWRKFKETNTSFKWPLFEMLASTAAFSAWAFSLPKSPLRDVCGFKEEVGAFIVLGTTVLLATVGYIMGKTARFEKA